MNEKRLTKSDTIELFLKILDAPHKHWTMLRKRLRRRTREDLLLHIDIMEDINYVSSQVKQ